jgi:hypothetical protein
MTQLVSTFDCLPGASAPMPVMPHAQVDSNGYTEGMWHVLAGPSSESGISVTPSTALTHGPVWQGVNLLAGDLGQLPWHNPPRPQP